MFVAGVLLGGMLGGLAGLLAAPRTGKDTREILKKTAQALPELAEDLTTMVQLRADQLSESSRRNWDDTLKRLQEAIAAGIEASQLETPSANVDDSNPQS
jgi:gas vesicle protein